MKRLTKKEVDKHFIEHSMPLIRAEENRYGVGRYRKDRYLRYESYNNYIDGICREGLITIKQANNYCIPAYLTK